LEKDFLGWLCGRCAAEGEKVLVPVWDDAAWPVQQAARAALGEAVVDGLPLAVAFGQVAPGGAGVEPPEDAIEDGTVVLPLAAPLAGARRKEGSQQLPLLVGKFVSLHTG